jgi:hypothetical protein
MTIASPPRPNPHTGWYPVRRVPLDYITESRAKPTDPVVQRYAADMRRGDVFPPVVLTGSAPYKIQDGNHRIAARQLAGMDTIDAIIIYKLRPLESARQRSVIAGAPAGSRCPCGRQATARASSGYPLVCAACASVR